MYKYNLVVCGGTFEYLHYGHKSFLKYVFSKGKRVLLGLTTDKYIEQTNKSTRISYEERKRHLKEFLTKEGFLNRVNIAPIDDLHIPKQWEDLPIDAIITTKDSFKGAEEINRRRRGKGFPALIIEVCPLVNVQDENRLSSSFFRDYDIGRNTLFLPGYLRRELKKPFGKLIVNFDEWYKKNNKFLKPEQTITVGDVITKTCNEFLLRQRISAVDFYVEREKKFANIEELGFSGKEQVIKVVNMAGTLTGELFVAAWDILHEKSDNRIVLQVDGEEDLAVLPFVLFAPIKFSIFYGQPGNGVVHIIVSEKTKQTAKSVINRFKK